MACEPSQKKMRWVPAIFGAVAVSLATFLLFHTLSRYSFAEVYASVAAIPATRFAIGAAFAAASYACLTGFDWMALKYVGRSLPYSYIARTSFCSLSLGHN